jgi:transposase
MARSELMPENMIALILIGKSIEALNDRKINQRVPFLERVSA